MTRTLLALSAAVLVAGCASTIADAPPNTLIRVPQSRGAQPFVSRQASGHAYVTTLSVYTGGVGLERFPITGGKLGSTPDLTYSAASGPIALTPDGSLYGVDNNNYLQLDHFPAGSTTPIVTLPSSRAARVLSTAV